MFEGMLLIRARSVAIVEEQELFFSQKSAKAPITNPIQSLQYQSQKNTLTISVLRFITTIRFETQYQTRSEHLPKRRPPQRKQLLQAVFGRYVLIHPTKRYRDYISILRSKGKQQNDTAVAS